MDIAWSPEEAAFRDEVRAFINREGWPAFDQCLSRP